MHWHSVTLYTNSRESLWEVCTAALGIVWSAWFILLASPLVSLPHLSSFQLLPSLTQFTEWLWMGFLWLLLLRQHFFFYGTWWISGVNSTWHCSQESGESDNSFLMREILLFGAGACASTFSFELNTRMRDWNTLCLQAISPNFRPTLFITLWPWHILRSRSKGSDRIGPFSPGLGVVKWQK